MTFKYWIYDEETFPNCFTISIVRQDGKHLRSFECSRRRNDFAKIRTCVEYLEENDAVMVGFNNLGFDYPVLHGLLMHPGVDAMSGIGVAKLAYKLAQAQIDSTKQGFPKTVPVYDWIVPQVDLYKIWHFDNKAKATGLKMLEFNMRSDNIEDLPYEVGTELADHEIDVLIQYNQHDILETLAFFNHSLTQIQFREQLTEKYGRNFMNHNDTKIGKDYFIMELEKQGVKCYIKQNGRTVPVQTRRPYINIADCLFDYYDFKRPEFIAILEWFKHQRIRETKGVFADIAEHRLGEVAKYAKMRTKRQRYPMKPSEIVENLFKNEYPCGWIDEVELKQKVKGEFKKSYWKCWNVADNLNVVVDGFQFDFGTGGIHGSLEYTLVQADEEHEIVDADVSSMYPNLAISNDVYPEHLGLEFCTIYKAVYEMRKSYKKGTPENLMLKLALNGVYGDSNNQYSPFYDPKYTMTITINGQLSLCLLAEKLMTIQGLQLIQVNTDGVTVKIPRSKRAEYDVVCKAWQEQVKLELEFAEYSKMFIRDVNNYIAVYTNGKVKRKGVYQYEDLGWHQNQGGLVIAKAAEAAMVHGKDIEEFIKAHTDKYDFLMRTKVPRSSSLYLEKDEVDAEGKPVRVKQQNICRYYVSKSPDSGKLIKVMPPLPKKPDEVREIGIESAWKVKTCNNMLDYDGQIDYAYYVHEARKLLVPPVFTREELAKMAEGSEDEFED